jgi:hypothetical protein
MSGALVFFGVVIWIVAANFFLNSPSITQQIAAIDLFVGGCVLVGCGAVMYSIDKMHTTVALAATSVNRHLHPSDTKASAKPAEEFHG